MTKAGDLVIECHVTVCKLWCLVMIGLRLSWRLTIFLPMFICIQHLVTLWHSSCKVANFCKSLRLLVVGWTLVHDCIKYWHCLAD